MGLQSDFFIRMDGEQISDIVAFSLQEHVGEHSSFSVTIRTDVLESNTDQDSLLGDSRRFLGRDFSIQARSIMAIEGYSELAFKGIITAMNPQKGFNGASEDVVIFEGYSSSIILDSGPQYRSYNQMPLADIVQETLGTYDQSKLTVTIAPEDNSTLQYSVMNGESRYQYLKRLAISRGEYLLYNTDTLYFGKPHLGDTIPLTYGIDLKSFKIGITPKHGKTTYLGHNYHTEEETTATTTDVITNAQGVTAIANTVADALYPNDTKELHHSYEHPDLQQRMDTMAILQKKVTEQQQISITGDSTHMGISVGKVISIRNDRGTYGSYRITNIKHSLSAIGSYQNHITAVPMDIDIFPLTDTRAFSTAQSNTATVVDTNDPDKMGRIKIRYPFDTQSGTTSPWIRVVTPYTGATYGHHMIPEIDSSVIVNYHSADIAQPYVIGAVYTGINKPDQWSSDANNKKVTRTRSGHTIELNDTEGQEMINIYDNEGSRISFNTQEKSLSITATENIEITAKNIRIAAEEHIDIQANQNIQVAAKQDLSALAEGTVALQSTGDMTARSSSNLALQAIRNLTATAQNTTIEGQTTAEINGTQTKITGQTLTEVSATIVKIN
ncbi:type VI secretion system Vgr family protein [Aquimarina longa]|uniref:type VI secretion system Vgr family protein n=1 Tax=Aquimarina longa TaxID=1080221 RepID=UPI000784F72E|nr:phage baseplate assembly protein V [Aquimarina longa]